MTKYRVHLQTVASATVRVEAENPDEAIDAAYEEVPSGVCAQCSGWGKDWSLDLGDWETDSQATTDQIVEEVED